MGIDATHSFSVARTWQRQVARAGSIGAAGAAAGAGRERHAGLSVPKGWQQGRQADRALCEIDTVFGPKAKENEEIRGLLNAGHRRSGVAGRCVVRGKQVFTEEIPAYCAVALAGLGGLPDTILSRCVVVRMRRRAPGERVKPFRRRVEVATGDAIRHRLEAWALMVQPEIGTPWPEMPSSIVDRDADIWEALLAVADAAGGDWPERQRKAAVSLVSESKGSTPSLGVRLLEDLRHVFGSSEHMGTDDIIKSLCRIDEAPWGC